MTDIQAIRERATAGYPVDCGGSLNAVNDIGRLLTLTDQQAAEIDRLTAVVVALESERDSWKNQAAMKY